VLYIFHSVPLIPSVSYLMQSSLIELYEHSLQMTINKTVQGIVVCEQEDLISVSFLKVKVGELRTFAEMFLKCACTKVLDLQNFLLIKNYALTDGSKFDLADLKNSRSAEVLIHCRNI